MKVLWLFAVALACLAEPPREIGNASMGLEGLHVKITTHATGSNAPGSFGVSGINRSSFRREIGDGKRTLFAYILQVERLPQDKRVRVIIKPAEPPTPTFASERELPLLWFGDKATLDVLWNPTTGAKVTDTIEVNEGPLVVQVGGSKHDLGLYSIRVLVDGKVAGEKPDSTVQGNGILMFYLPGRGSYFFSTRPVAGSKFSKIGVVDRNRIRFQIENEQFEVVSAGQVLSQTPAGELWVLHDPRPPTWRSANETRMSIGGGDKMEDFYRD